jgi:undecaprenyl-diphosphatase
VAAPWTWLTQLELPLFDLIHLQGHHPMLDVVFRFVTSMHQSPHGQALILIGVGLLAWRVSWRRTLCWVATLVVAVGVSDLTLTYGVKRVLDRPRPHHLEWVRAEPRGIHRPRHASFPSNHATNSSVVGAVTSVFFPFLAAPLGLLVFLVGYSRVYLGVHFPLDVAAGWIVGWLWGWWIAAWARRKFYRRYDPK